MFIAKTEKLCHIFNNHIDLYYNKEIIQLHCIYVICIMSTESQAALVIDILNKLIVCMHTLMLDRVQSFTIFCLSLIKVYKSF